MSTKIEVISNTSGIRLELGNSKAFLFTTEAAELIEALQQAMAHCGAWSVTVSEPVRDVRDPATG